MLSSSLGVVVFRVGIRTTRPALRRARVSGVGAVGDGSVADRGDADGVLSVSELIDDAIRADAERAEAFEPPPEFVSGERVAFEQAEGVFDGVDQWPVEVEQFEAGAACEDDVGQASAGGAAFGELVA
jgi:hypothetical protein